MIAQSSWTLTDLNSYMDTQFDTLWTDFGATKDDGTKYLPCPQLKYTVPIYGEVTFIPTDTTVLNKLYQVQSLTRVLEEKY